MPYVSKDKYLGKSPEARDKQLANLKYTKISPKMLVKERKKLQGCNIIDFATDPNYLGLSFAKRPVQEVILRALYGLPLDKKQLKIFKVLTKGKGKYTPGKEKLEAIMCLGARAGKSFLVSIVALYEATRDKWKDYVSKGENPYIVIIATRQKQAEQIIQANCSRMLENSPLLRRLIKGSFQTELTLTNGVKILSLPCGSTQGRGLPIMVAIYDEIAFFRLEGVRADEVIYNSLNPRQSQFPDCKMLMISTAGAKQGLFYQFFSEGFRIEDRLTIQGETRFINPEIPQKFIDKEFLRNPENANREYKGIFAEKIEAFFTRDVLDKVILLAGDLEYNSKYTYFLGIDQSGLADRDLFGLSIAHNENEKIIIDLMRSYKTKDFDYILSNIKDFIKQYNLVNASIDKYAKGYISNSLTKLGLIIEIRPDLSVVYLNLKALILNQKISLPDNSELKEGLLNTQAYYNKQNAINISHERSIEGHSDLADSLATVAFLLKLGGEGGPTVSEFEKMIDDVSAQEHLRDKNLSGRYVDEVGDVTNPSGWQGPGSGEIRQDW